MQVLSQLLSVFFGFTLLFISCQKKESPTTVRVTIQAPGMKDSLARIVTLSQLNYKENILQEGRLNSQGSATMESPLAKPIFAFLSIGDHPSAKPKYDTSMRNYSRTCSL